MCVVLGGLEYRICIIQNLKKMIKYVVLKRVDNKKV